MAFMAQIDLPDLAMYKVMPSRNGSVFEALMLIVIYRCPGEMSEESRVDSGM